jgi:uncharacterized protein (DUF362 family)
MGKFERIGDTMAEKNFLNRRDFLKQIGITGAGVLLTGCGRHEITELPSPDISRETVLPTPADLIEEADAATPTAQNTADTYLSVVRGNDPAAMVQRALAAIGGLDRFVPAGSDVIIKPNICTDYYSFEFGATTNPEVVGTLVAMSIGAGARRVRVMDNPFGGTAQSAYLRSGIEEAVTRAGGEMEVMNRNKFKLAEIPNGVDIREWIFYKDILDADVVIDVPIAKHHGTTRLTLGCKNLMGTILDRGKIHANIHQRIADLVSRVRPALTVIDATRTLMRNGPTGGNLDDVRLTNTIIASADIVAADSYAATLFDLNPADIGYIQAAADMGLGVMDLSSIKMEELSI